MVSERRWKRLLRVLRPVREQAERDVDVELAHHLEMRAREHEARGLDPAAARDRANREFGDLARARAVMRTETVTRERRARRLAALGEAWQDVRVGARSLRANKLFTLVAVLTLALGVGANTAMFGMVNAVLLRPLPYERPGELVQLWETLQPDVPRNVVSRGNYLDWRDQARAFTDVAAYMLDFGFGVTGGAQPLQVTASQVAPSLFEVLGVDAQIGRTFSAQEGERPGGLVALLSHSFWTTAYGGDPGVLGRTLTVDGTPVEVVGVMPASFAFPSRQTQMWFPLAFGPEDRNDRGPHMLHVVGRLAPGATVASARAEMEQVAASQAELYPEAMEGWGADVMSLRGDITRNVRPALLVLLAAVGLVLLVACANVANLMLARSLEREKEVAVRAALGAGRWRLVRQFLTESALLAALGGLAGLGIGALTLRMVGAFDPGEVPLIETARVDSTVLVFAVGASLFALFAFALLPALRAARVDLQSTLRKVSARDRGGALRSTLLVAEIAVSVVLIVGAGLLLRSFATLRALDAGLDPDNVLTVQLNLPTPKYAQHDLQVAFYDEVVTRIAALPGVVDAAGTSEPPVIGYRMTFNVAVDGYTFSPDEREDLYFRAVMPGYFSTLRIPIVSGRAFTAADRLDGRAVAIVNEAMAARFWPAGDALGGRVRVSSNGPWHEVVGIAANVRHDGLEREEPAAVYGPFSQKAWSWMTWMTLMVRTNGEPGALANAVRDAVWSVDPDLPIQSMSTLEAVYGDSMARRTFTTTLLVAFALLAVILGTVGVYGVVAFAVARRTREIGVRMALGAVRGQVVKMIVASGLRLAVIGAAVGLGIALLASPLIRGLLYGIGAFDVWTYAGATVLVTVVTIAACWLPARRAARIEPYRVLRVE